MDPNSQPAPAAPAAPEPAAPVAPAAPAAPAPAEPAAPATPAPRTQDPVDHSVPANPVPADPAAPPADPAEPPADPDNPEGTPPADPDAPAEPDAAALAGEVEDDELQAQIDAAAAKDPEGALPQGINADGTIDPLVYAYEQMPTITVQGKEGVKGEVKTYTVKTADDLPADFRFATQVEQTKFASALQQNMNIANELIAEANGHNEARVAQMERRTVLVAQKGEVDALIASGKLPAITAKPGDPNFMQDPGAIRAQQVLDHMKQVNADNKAAGINQEITSVALGLQLLEAAEAIAARDGRVHTITNTRNGVNAKISGGNPPAPAAPAGTQQTIHKDARSAVAAGRKRLGL